MYAESDMAMAAVIVLYLLIGAVICALMWRDEAVREDVLGWEWQDQVAWLAFCLFAWPLLVIRIDTDREDGK